MEIRNLMEITPEIENAARELLEASEKLKKLVGNNVYYSLDISHNGTDHINIYDRHEYSRDGLGTNLGFFAHRIFVDGKVILDFIPEENEDAQIFSAEFEKEYHSDCYNEKIIVKESDI